MNVEGTVLRINSRTFEPEMVVTLVVPMEALRKEYTVMLGEEEFHTILGKELISALYAHSERIHEHHETIKI